MTPKKISYHFTFYALNTLIFLLAWGFPGTCPGQAPALSKEAQDSGNREITLIPKVDLISVVQGIWAYDPWYYTIELEYIPKGNQVVSFDLGLGLQGAKNRFFEHPTPAHPQAPEEAISSMVGFQAESGIRIYPLNYILSVPKRGQLVYLRAGVGLNVIQLTEEFYIPRVPEETYTGGNLYGFIQPGVQYQLGGRFHIEGAMIVRLGKKSHPYFPSYLFYPQAHPKLNLGFAF